MAGTCVTRVTFLILYGVSGALVTSNTTGPSCTIKSVVGGGRGVCAIAFHNTDCTEELDRLNQQHFSSLSSSPQPSSSSSSSPSSSSSTRNVRISEKRLNSVNSVVDLRFKLQEEGETVLVVRREDSAPTKRHYPRPRPKGRGVNRRSSRSSTSSSSSSTSSGSGSTSSGSSSTRSISSTSSDISSTSSISSSTRSIRSTNSGSSSTRSRSSKGSGRSSTSSSSSRRQSSRGYSSSGGRCVMIAVTEGVKGEEVVVKELPLPLGRYNFTEYFMPTSSSSSSSLQTLQPTLSSLPSPSSSSSSASSLSPVALGSIVLSHNVNGNLYEWEKTKKRNLRVGSTNLEQPPKARVWESGSGRANDAGKDIILVNDVSKARKPVNDAGKRSVLEADTGQDVLEADTGQDILDADTGQDVLGGMDYSVGDTDDECTCCNCYNMTHHYYEWTAILTYDFTVNASCPTECADVRVQLYQDRNITNKAKCDVNYVGSMLYLYPYGYAKNVTRGPLTYPNMGTGCYLFELQPLVYPIPEHLGFIWLKPKIETLDIKKWNATIYIEPNPETHSIRVTWSENFGYNFTLFQLQLWHHTSKDLSCRGDYLGPITVYPIGHKLVVNKTEYKFENMSIGYYCARLTPQDDILCLRDGCPPISTPPKELGVLVKVECPTASDCERSLSMRALVLLALAGTVATVTVAVIVACWVLRCRPVLSGARNVIYSPVPVNAGSIVARPVVVLLVWTPHDPHGQQLTRVVAAFKSLLRSYANCQVYDYLDLMGLPDAQRNHLLAYPIAWLETILNSPDVKIIIIATAGARKRQAESFLKDPASLDTAVDTPSLDPILFPYLLRRLQDQPDLAANYSRVFHIRFSEVSDASAELEGIVSWTRYRLPEHLPALARSLHGDHKGPRFDSVSVEQLAGLTRALRDHPGYIPHISPPSSPSPDILTSTRPCSKPGLRGPVPHTDDIGGGGSVTIGNGTAHNGTAHYDQDSSV